MTNLSQKVQMPLLPLVTIPNFTLDTMEIDFMMEVKTSESSSTKDSSSDTSSSSVGTDTKAEVSFGFWGVKGSASTSIQTENKTSGTVSSSKDTQTQLGPKCKNIISMLRLSRMNLLKVWQNLRRFFLVLLNLLLLRKLPIQLMNRTTD